MKKYILTETELEQMTEKCAAGGIDMLWAQGYMDGDEWTFEEYKESTEKTTKWQKTLQAFDKIEELEHALSLINIKIGHLQWKLDEKCSCRNKSL